MTQTAQIEIINPFTGEELTVSFSWHQNYQYGTRDTPEVNEWSYDDFDVFQVDGKPVDDYEISSELYKHIYRQVSQLEIEDLI